MAGIRGILRILEVELISESSVPVPEEIGPYRVLRPLAQGGMAAVFEAEDRVQGEKVAVKLLTHRGLARPRFAREYRALTRLDHPNIVRVYRYGLHEGTPYLSMELLNGQAVQVHVQRLGLPGSENRTREVVRIGAAVSEALFYLHERGIVHRDLKSSNIMVLGDGRVKLLDFGTARFLTGNDDITRQGEFVGTFAYASPEQVTGEPVDASSDLYSLGVLLYRLSTGKRPFKADSAHELARMHVERKPVAPRKLVAALPEALERLIMRLLEKDPADRPQSAERVAEYLKGQVPGASPPKQGSLGPARLVGRTEHLTGITATLRRAKPGRMILIVGPEGSGRMRMLRSAIAVARQTGWRSYGGSFGGEAGLGILLTIADEITRSLEPGYEIPEMELDENLQTGSVQEQLFNHLTSAVVSRCRSDAAPVVLGLGDLHRASPMALDALSHLRHQVRKLEAPVLFVATAPDDSDAPGTAIRQRLPDAWRVELKPLSPPEVQRLIQSMLGGRPMKMPLVRQIHRVTGGMPGFVGEVLRAMVQGKLIESKQTPEGLEWLDLTGGELKIPTTARDAILLRLDALEPLQRRGMEALAVAGGDAKTETLAHALEMASEDLGPELDELVSLRLLDARESPSGEVWRFRLELTRELVLEKTRAIRRDVLRRRLAEAMASHPPSPSKIRLLADAGRAKEAVAEAVAWAEPLLEWSRAAEVRPVLDRAVGVVSQVRDPDQAVLARLFLLLGRCQLILRPGDREAEHPFQRALALANSPGLRSECELHYSRLLVARGDISGAQTQLERAQKRAPVDDVALQAEIGMNLGSVHWYQGGFTQAQGWFERGLEAARIARLGRQVGRGLLGRGVVHLTRGALRLAEEDLREAGQHYEVAGDRGGLWHVQANLCDLLRRKGDFSEAVQLLSAELPALREGATAFRYALMLLNLAEIEVEMLRLGRARQRVEQVESDLPLDDHLHLKAGVGLVKAKIALAAGEHGEAAEILGPLVSATEEARLMIISSQIRAYFGEAQILSGQASGLEDLAHAIDHLQQAAHLPVLGDACAARARAMGDREDPDLSFAPVLRWMRDEPARTLRLEYLIASAEYAAAANARDRSVLYWQEADILLSDILDSLTLADREAMGVHPWVISVAKGLRR